MQNCSAKLALPQTENYNQKTGYDGVDGMVLLLLAGPHLMQRMEETIALATRTLNHSYASSRMAERLR